MKTIQNTLPTKSSLEKTLGALLTVVGSNLLADKSGLLKTHQLRDEDNQAMVQLPQVKAVPTSTQHELNTLKSKMISYMDTTAAIENTNRTAMADVIVNDVVVLSKVPVTVLMPLKKQLSKLLPIINNIRVLDKATEWRVAEGQEYVGVYVTCNPITTEHKVNNKVWKVIAEATAHHPAQLKEVITSEHIGNYTTTHFSGNMHSAVKINLLTRLTEVITAVESAIQTANSTTEIIELNVGDVLMNHVFGVR